MQLHNVRTWLCRQQRHTRTRQNIVSGRERAAATDVSRIVAVAHTTMSIGMDNNNNTTQQQHNSNNTTTTQQHNNNTTQQHNNKQQQNNKTTKQQQHNNN